MAPLFDMLFRKPRLRRELTSLRGAISLKHAAVAAAETSCRKAWGKKWSYIQMQRRKHEAAADGDLEPVEIDGQADVLEMRRQQCLGELKSLEQELERLLDRERILAAELGEKPALPPEVSGEER